MPFGQIHFFLRKLAKWTLYGWFREIEVLGEENVPENGVVVVACSHHNQVVDPAVLSCFFPHGRPLHYWAKQELFSNSIARSILLDAGNIPVDRKTKNNAELFKTTFEVMEKGEAVAIFPEGTSYTEPRITTIKTGLAWAVLEYAKHVHNLSPEERAAIPAGEREAVVLPTGIVYENKSKYRSRTVMQFGTPISVKPYLDEFLSASGQEEEPAKRAVRRLTADIQDALVKLTVNAEDWPTLHAAKMARELLWEREQAVPLEHFVEVSQALIDVFSMAAPADAEASDLKHLLLTYQALLLTTNLTNSAISSLPLPKTLDPSAPVPLPSRLSTLAALLSDTLVCLVQLPFFFLPLIIHIPTYLIAKRAERAVQDEEESMAQSKIFLGLIFTLLIYPILFFCLWAFLLLTPVGFLFALAVVWGFAVYHVSMVDRNYDAWKTLVAAWRVLLGVWLPKRWDLDLAAASYAVDALKEGAAIKHTIRKAEKPGRKGSAMSDSVGAGRKSPTATSTATPSASDSLACRPTSSRAVTEDVSVSDAFTAANATPPATTRGPSSRRLVRHLLRTRLASFTALGAYLGGLERNGTEEQKALVGTLRRAGARWPDRGEDVTERGRGAEEWAVTERGRGAEEWAVRSASDTGEGED